MTTQVEPTIPLSVTLPFLMYMEQPHIILLKWRRVLSAISRALPRPSLWMHSDRIAAMFFGEIAVPSEQPSYLLLC